MFGRGGGDQEMPSHKNKVLGPLEYIPMGTERGVLPFAVWIIILYLSESSSSVYSLSINALS